jgi:disulfide oxidoreductase YuzD
MSLSPIQSSRKNVPYNLKNKIRNIDYKNYVNIICKSAQNKKQRLIKKARDEEFSIPPILRYTKGPVNNDGLRRHEVNERAFQKRIQGMTYDQQMIAREEEIIAERHLSIGRMIRSKRINNESHASDLYYDSDSDFSDF